MTFTAKTALPCPHLEGVTAGMRAELRHQLLEAEIAAVGAWLRLIVEGPHEFADDDGGARFDYRATLAVPKPTDNDS